jgi:hypothetical protein
VDPAEKVFTTDARCGLSATELVFWNLSNNIVRHAERSHSHRGFSPVIRTEDKNEEPFERFFSEPEQKPLKRFEDRFGDLNHRAEATV